jgi:hypothetical protein
MISAVDEDTCDDEARVANKTKPDNQSLDVAVVVRLTRNTPEGTTENSECGILHASLCNLWTLATGMKVARA